MAQRASTALAGAVPLLCVCGARGRFGGLGPVPGVVSLPCPPSRPACPALCVAGRPVPVSLTPLAGTPFHAVCAFRELGPVALLVVPACPLRVCALALPRRPLPSPLGGVACAPRVVPALGAGRAVPRGLCPSACPAPVPCSVWRAWGGAAWSRFPPTWLGVVSPPWGGAGAFLCRGAGWGSGEGASAPRSPFVRPGGPVGREVALARSVPLPSLGRQQSGCHWRCSGHGGCGPHTAEVRARPPSLGAVGVASWRVGAGSLVPRAPCGSRRLGRGGRAVLRPPLGRRGLIGGRGDHPLCLRGVGAGAPPAWGPAGGAGGGVAPRPPCAPSEARPAVPYPGPPLVFGASPRGLRVRSGVAGPPRAPGAACLAGGGGVRGGPWTAPPGAPSDLNPPSAFPEWAMVMGGSWGARPPYCSGAPPHADPGLGRRAALARCCGLARRPRPPREQEVGGARARCVHVKLRLPPPPASRSLLGEGGRPLGSVGAEGRRSCGPQAGGGAGGGAGGVALAPPAPLGVGLPSVVSGAPPPGYTRAVGVVGQPWAPGAARSAANGSLQLGGEGGGE